VRRKNQGGESFEDRNLASFGWNAKDAIKFALTHLRRQSASVSIESAVDQLLEAKRAAGCTKRCCRDVGIHLGRLARAFEGKKIAEISTADLESFLAGLQLGPGTRNTYRRDIRHALAFCREARMATAASARNTERATAIDKPPGILRPEQIAALLAESRDNDLLAYHAIGCFAGLRANEIKATPHLGREGGRESQ
jgi:site-specific recombinase XerD